MGCQTGLPTISSRGRACFCRFAEHNPAKRPIGGELNQVDFATTRQLTSTHTKHTHTQSTQRVHTTHTNCAHFVMLSIGCLDSQLVGESYIVDVMSDCSSGANSWC